MSLPAVDVGQSPVEKFREYLVSRPTPQRFTDQQKDLVEHIFARHSHFDADQLLKDLEGTGSAISRATVYRTLTKLVDSGMLRKLEIGTRVFYEHDYGYPQHDHLHCTGCQTLIEFSSADLGKILDAVAALHQFRAQGHRLIISGLCMNCRSNRSRSRHQDRI